MRAAGAWAATLLLTTSGSAADTLASLVQLGGARDSINAIATDSSGNIIVAGGTSSFNLPVTNGSANRGTPLSVSTDFGQTWAPLSTIAVRSVVLDASSPPVLYGLSSTDPNVPVNLVMKSIDGGKTWVQTGTFSAVSALAADPTQPGVLYAGDTPGIFKSTDGGQTWQGPVTGFANPSGFLYFSYIVADPFHPNMVYTAVPGDHPYRSSDGGQTWTPYSIPSMFFYSLVFDRLEPGVVYQGTDAGLFQSTDAGQTWSLLNTPFGHPGTIVPDSKTAGVVYVADQNTGFVYRSTDKGADWTTLLTAQDASTTFAEDPFGASVFFTGSQRSGDAGATWQPLTLGRPASQFLFDPTVPGRVLAAAAPSNDAFLAKLDPTGQKVLFATYLGGIGNDYAASVAVDPSGNIYVAGTAGSGFPVTPGVIGLAPNPFGNSFVAKFDSAGNLLFSTYLPDPRGTGLQGLVVDTSLNVYVSGFANYNHPPYTCFVDKISPDGATLLFAEDLPAMSCSVTKDPVGDIVSWGPSRANMYPPPTIVIKLDSNGTPIWWRTLASAFGTASALAFDATGDIYLTGSVNSPDFSATPGAYKSAASRRSSSCPMGLESPAPVDAYVAKLDPDGSTLAATYFGGDCYNFPRAIAIAPDGGAWVLMRTGSDDFPLVAPFGNVGSSNGFGTFIAQFDPNLTDLLLSAPIGAGQNPVLFIDPSGTVYIGGDATFLAAIESH